MKVFTHETFAATVDKDNIRSNLRLLEVMWRRNSWIWFAKRRELIYLVHWCTKFTQFTTQEESESVLRQQENRRCNDQVRCLCAEIKATFVP